MSETLPFEPAYDPIGEFDVPEFDAQIPEYINPEWDDDALFNLISANQDVLVDVDGSIMTLSAAMNEHPGPWTPENEPNLIAYAEALLAKDLLEPKEVEEQLSDEVVEQETTLDLPVVNEQASQDAVPRDSGEAASERSDLAHEKTALKFETPPAVADVPAPVRVTRAVKDIEVAVDDTGDSSALKRIDRNDQTKIGPRATGQVVETMQSDEAERPAPAEKVRPLPRQFPDVTEAVATPDTPMGMEQITIDTPDDTDDEPVVDASALEATKPSVLAPEEPIESHVNDLPIDILETEIINEFETIEDDEDEVLLDVLAEDVPDVAEDLIDEARSSETGEIADEVETALALLAELIESNEPEENDEVSVILHDFFEAPTRREITTKEEWMIVYTELFAAAGVACSPETIESLAEITLKWNLIDEIEKLEDKERDVEVVDESNAHMIVRKLLAAFTSIIQAIRHIFAIGTYVLRLSVAPRVGYR